jgi:hypothetical protein
VEHSGQDAAASVGRTTSNASSEWLASAAASAGAGAGPQLIAAAPVAADVNPAADIISHSRQRAAVDVPDGAAAPAAATRACVSRAQGFGVVLELTNVHHRN